MNWYDKINGDSPSDTKYLRDMAKEAEDYIKSFKWVKPIEEAGLEFGVGGIIALFLFHFEEPISPEDDRLWVVVGDVPTAYLVVEDDDTIGETISRYCDMMEDWAQAVESGGDLSEVFPIKVERTIENAIDLKNRVKFIRKNFT